MRTGVLVSRLLLPLLIRLVRRRGEKPYQGTWKTVYRATDIQSFREMVALRNAAPRYRLFNRLHRLLWFAFRSKEAHTRGKDANIPDIYYPID